MTHPYKLSKNQSVFVRDAERCGHKIDFQYSGRGMEGKVCPAVRLDRGEGFDTKAHVSRDSMGKGTVVYAVN